MLSDPMGGRPVRPAENGGGGGAHRFEDLVRALEGSPPDEVLEGVSALRVQFPAGEENGFLVQVRVTRDVVLSSPPMACPETSDAGAVLREVRRIACTLRDGFERSVSLRSDSVIVRLRDLASEAREIDKAWALESKEYSDDSGGVPLRLLTPYDGVKTDYAHMAWEIATALARAIPD